MCEVQEILLTNCLFNFKPKIWITTVKEKHLNNEFQVL
jgi:hypothetical protein